MDVSRDLIETFKAFHLDHPEATWHELRARLIETAEGLLSSVHGLYTLGGWGDLYEDVGMNLREISATMALSADQHEHVANAQRVMAAAQDRLQGDPVPLVKLIRELGARPDAELPTTEAASVSQSVRGPALTFETLCGLYMADRAGDLKATTLVSTKATHGVLKGLLGPLDLRAHTREHLVALRDQLAATRKPSTVNQMIVKLSAILKWAVDNGHLEKSFDKKLKFTKGTESTRKAFSQEHIELLMKYANGLSECTWKRWLLSLGLITGARLNEISQLTVSDVQTTSAGITVIHINEAGEGKSIKNKRSERLVPLTDGAYGFDLKAFLQYVEARRVKGQVALAQIGYRPAGEWVNQQAIPEALGASYGRGMVFHSVRHSLASLMQAKGVPTIHAQAVMGHASGTITFDTYGSGVPVDKLAAMLRDVFSDAMNA